MSQDKDEILAMAREAGAVFDPQWGIASNTGTATFERFATLCRAPLVAEVERLEQWHAEMADNRNAIASERDTLKAELEQTRVQLAGCGVTAMQNTEGSKAHRIERGAYGWSESYGDVCRMVDSEIELRAEIAALKQAHEINADTLNAMQVEIDDWKARALKAEQAGEPVAYIAWKDGKPCYEGDDAICEDAVWPVDSDDDRTSMPVCTAPQPAAQEPTSAVPVVEQLVEALDGLFSGDVVVWSLGGSARPRAAIEAGKKFIKENGK